MHRNPNNEDFTRLCFKAIGEPIPFNYKERCKICFRRVKEEEIEPISKYLAKHFNYLRSEEDNLKLLRKPKAKHLKWVMHYSLMKLLYGSWYKYAINIAGDIAYVYREFSKIDKFSNKMMQTVFYRLDRKMTTRIIELIKSHGFLLRARGYWTWSCRSIRNIFLEEECKVNYKEYKNASKYLKYRRVLYSQLPVNGFNRISRERCRVLGIQ